MGAKASAGLQPKHWKALELIEEGSVSLKEIAQACQIPLDTMYDLYEGDTKKTGEIGNLFKSELDKITARNSAKVKHLVKDNQKLALYKINEYLRATSKKKPTPELVEEMNSVLRSISKSMPSVEIGSLSISRGLSAEDLVNEFKRLSSVARFALDGGRVSGARAGRSGILPASSRRGDSVQEK